MCIVRSDDQQVLSVSANGFGKRTPLSEWKVQGRSGVGIIAIDASERNGAMVKLSLVNMDDQLVVITDGGQLIRIRVAQIREAGRNTQGVRIIRLNNGERVVDVAPIAERDEEENGINDEIEVDEE
jgi:DNA gyrase subunit A